MIRKIKFKNFYSFKKEQVIDFTTTKKKSDVYFDAFDGKQVSKVIGVVGPNNSGKTNVMKLFGFFKFFLTSSTRERKDEYDTAYKSYAFSEKNKTSLSIEFETQNYLCEYSVSLNQIEVFQEKLRIRKLEKNSKPTTVFTRDDKGVVVNPKLIKGVTGKRLSSLRKDVSTVAFIRANYEEAVINEVSSYFDSVWTNVNEAGLIFTPEERLGEVASIYNDAPEIKEKMEDFIKNFDLGIESFKITKTDNRTDIEACHKISNKEYRLPIFYESRGTKALFVDLLNILACTELNGTVLVIDEIEMGLHPEAVNKLVQFIVEQFSKSKKQFVFASHSLEFLKKFDAPQIYLVEKNKNESEVYRLDELNVRTDDNYFAKYMSGSYGAFPRISV